MRGFPVSPALEHAFAFSRFFEEIGKLDHEDAEGLLGWSVFEEQDEGVDEGGGGERADAVGGDEVPEGGKLRGVVVEEGGGAGSHARVS